MEKISKVLNILVHTYIYTYVSLKTKNKGNRKLQLLNFCNKSNHIQYFIFYFINFVAFNAQENGKAFKAHSQ